MPKKKSTTPVKQSADRATRYAIDVVEKRIIAGTHVIDSCKRHLRDLEKSGDDWNYYYDQNEALEAMAFFEEILCLNGGQFEGKPFLLLPWQAFVVSSIFGWKRKSDGFRRFRVVYCEQGKGNGKALAIDTKIPTPSGWLTMDDLSVGDQVFNEAGEICNVVATTDTMFDHYCYRLTFSDGSKIVADANHLWKTYVNRTNKQPQKITVDGITKSISEWSRLNNISVGVIWARIHNLGWSHKDAVGISIKDGKKLRVKWRHNYNRNEKQKGFTTKNELSNIHTTEEIYRTLLANPNGTTSKHPQAKWNHCVDVALPLLLPDIMLPLPAYSLGAWLGDGDSDCARITIAYSDWQIIDEINKEGVPTKEQRQHSENVARVAFSDGRSQAKRDASFQSKLRSNNLLNNKHIPRKYFRASVTQRLSLLQGIMDTDGHVAKNGHCEITLCSEMLINDVKALLITLGYKCVVHESGAMLNGIEVGRRWRISFQAYKSQPPVRLRRKVNNLGIEPVTKLLSRGRMIVGCEKIESVPVKCITVDSVSSLYLAGENMIPTHNSPLAAGIGLKGLVADNEPRSEVYSAACFRDQAMVLFRDACAFFDQSVELKKRLKASGSGEKRWNLSYPETGSFFRVISSEKKGQSGPRPHMALLDEIHEFPDGNIIEMLRAGFKFRRQPLSFMITNSGSDKSSVCWEYHDLGTKVAAGIIENEEFFSFICSLDEEDLVDDRFLDDESCWIKANPSLDAGIPGYDYIRQQVQEARGLPSKMATVKRLCFCVWVAADNPWLSGELWFGCQQSGGIPESILINRKCWGGLDLSSTQDLTAFALLFEPGYVEEEFIEMEKGKGGVWQKCERKFDPFWRLKCWFWIPGDNLLAKENIDHVPYTVWRDKGYLTALPGRAINKSSVVKLIYEVSRKFDLQGIAFDRAKIKDLDEFAEKSGVELTFGSWNREKRQWDWEPGDGIRMMPFGQESRSMDPAISKFEGMLSSKGEIVENNPALLHDGNPVLTWCAANAVTIEDEDKNRKLSKKKSTGRIDGIISAVMAAGVSESNATGKSVFDGKDKETIKRMLRGEE